METPDGVRRYPDGTSRPGSDKTAARLTERRERYEREGRVAWSDLLLEAIHITPHPQSFPIVMSTGFSPDHLFSGGSDVIQ